MKNTRQRFTIKFIFLLLILLNKSLAEDRNCDFFKYCGGNSGNSRASAQSLPSSSSAANLNPSNISQVRGLGLETTYQAGNPLAFGLVTGNGKVGALLSPSEENSFFGNRPIEMDSDYYSRRLNEKQYKNKKLNLALGLNLIGKENFGLDVGVSAKRNPEIKKINPGIGVAARLSIFTVGAYIYNDDVKVTFGNNVNLDNSIPYSVLYNDPTYQEKFQVKTIAGGMRIFNLLVDAAVMKTKYKLYADETEVRIFSASYTIRKFSFNYAQRLENSANADFVNEMLVEKREKKEIYAGFQFLINKHFMVGMAYNNYLLHEISGSLTIFL